MTTPIPASTTFQFQPPAVKYASKHAFWMGITEIVLGVLSIIFHIPTIVYETGMFFVGHGIWCGIFVSQLE